MNDMCKNLTPTVIRQSLIFLIIKLFVFDLFLLTAYILLELPIILLADTDPTPATILTADWFGIITLTVTTLVEMIFVIILVLQWVNEYYEISRYDISHRHGVIKIREDRHLFRNFSAVSIIQTIPGRIFNYGTIKLYNPALNHELLLHRISNPNKYIRQITESIPASADMIVNKN